MDFLDPKKKRARRIRLIIGYILIGIAIGLVTLILIFQSYGYDLDRKTGAIIQNGLVFVAAQPEPASIYMNGKQYSNLDNARLVLPANVYNLELRRDGYREWKRTFSLAGGTIDRFVYPFLFPNNLDTQTQQPYAAAPTFATQSPDRRWILVQQPGQLGTFDLFDANNPTQAARAVAVPQTVFTASATHQLVAIEWANDNRHVLVRHQFAEGQEYLLLDIEQPAQSSNINRQFNRNPTQVSLRDKKFDKFYLYDQPTGALDFAETGNATIRRVLDGVLAYEPHGEDMILYATATNAPAGKTNIILKDNDGSFVLRETAPSPQYLLAMARYDNKWFVAAGAANEGRVYVYKDPQGIIKQDTTQPPIPVSVLRADNPTWIKFSANTQFIAMNGGQQFAVYDAENDQDYRYTLQQPIDAAPQPLSWMDGHRLLVTSGGKMVVFDYDGINLQSLANNLPGITPFFDRDYKIMFNVGASTDGATQPFNLSRTDLRIAR